MLNLTAAEGSRNIELGCGDRPHPACHVHVDVRPGPGVDFTVDLGSYPWPIQGDEFDAVYSAYTLEHISWRHTVDFLKECFRILKPTGNLILLTPNTEEQMRHLLKTKDWKDGGSMLFGDLDYPENSHKAFINPALMLDWLLEAGFTDVLFNPFGAKGTDLITRATKPAKSPSEVIANEMRETLDVAKAVDQSRQEALNEVRMHASSVMVSTPDAPVSVQDVKESAPAEKLPPAVQLFDRRYWDGGNEYGGFPHYWDFPCLPAGELIIAEDGLRQIETLNEGELVMTHMGRFRPIVEVMRRPYQGRLITVRPRYAPAVRLTPEHPVLVVPVCKKYRQSKAEIAGEPEWVNAGDLDVTRHWLVIPRPAVEGVQKFNSDLMRLTGYYLSEGSTSKTHRGMGAVQFAFHQDEGSYIEDVQQLMTRMFGTHGHVRFDKLSRAATVGFYSPNAKMMMDNLGNCSYSKRLPISTLNATDEGLCELLIGMFRGDGSLGEQNQLRYGTVSRSLASMVRLMLLRLGVVSALRWNPPPKKFSEIAGRAIKSKGYWEIAVTGRSMSKLARFLQLDEDRQNRTWKMTGKDYDFCHMDDDNLYVPIRSIKEEMYDGVVYNFEVEEDHSYMHPGASLHNCHAVTARHVLARKPVSVLELGCSRGYVMKRLQDAGVHCTGVDVSTHCWHTRACDGVLLGDLTGKWPVPEPLKPYGLCFSIAVLDHLPEESLPHVVKNMARFASAGLHGVNFGSVGGDRTRQTCKPLQWWKELFATHAPGWPVEVMDKDELESGQLPPEYVAGDGTLKLNLGSYSTMFHDGWVNVDVEDLTEFAKGWMFRFLRHDVRDGLPFGTESASCVYSSHMLEHLTYAEGLKFLKEVRRVLKPTGVFRVLVPNANLLMRCFQNNEMGRFDELSGTVAAAKTQTQKLYELLHANHQSMYDQQTLEGQLRAAGLKPFRAEFRQTAAGMPAHCEQASRQIIRETLDMFPTVSLVMEATVP